MYYYATTVYKIENNTYIDCGVVVIQSPIILSNIDEIRKLINE
jgi:hypothetical protein